MKPVFSAVRLSSIAALVGSLFLAIARSFGAESLVVCAPDGIHVATVTDQGRIQYRTVNDDAIQYTFYICHPHVISFSEDGKLLAAAGGGSGGLAKIKIWSVSDHHQLCEIVTRGEAVNVLGLSSDGSLVVGARADGRVEVWLVSDGQSQWSRTLSNVAKSMRFSSDSKGLFVTAEDGIVHTFGAKSGNRARF